MSIYHANDFIVALPDGLRDKTTHIFSLTEEGPSDISIVVARERPKSGETVELFVERLFTLLLSRLPAFRVLKRELLRVDNQPAVSIEYTWTSNEGPMFQRQVVLYAKGPHQMLLLTATCRGDKMASRWSAMFNDFLTNFRLRT
ncbi:DcrB-related protein [Polyangium sp. 15x6]|uniref:DcrB-related protein n=1 Tax=Polyangium sp. 15x6 TaxID=3042687 RepID=UPI00249BCF75|nr:DcrB-related protein [Polyangium sp. 15x6]MDI3287315.1 DcrB-related protein [Polyangium sp. 15x6]